ncbi:XdhC family protein [Rhizobium pusense]|nr:XdhC family protein [Agrobacterium pusense]
MLESVSRTASTPSRAHALDDPREILSFAVAAFNNGGCAIASLIEINGGAARALGAQMAIAQDGRFCGYLSGGCIEAAVAAEALAAMAEGRDRIIKIGEGSGFFDLRLPCGGSITVAIHVLRNGRILPTILHKLTERQAVASAYLPESEELKIVEPVPRSGWKDQSFITSYHPPTRLIISGQHGETEALRRLALSVGYEVIVLSGRSNCLQFEQATLDEWTAVVLMHHDLDGEEQILQAALSSPAFYIGALGSSRTHSRRVEKLVGAGHSQGAISRIRAPIGMFGPCRDFNTLSISVLADVSSRASTR